MEQIHKVATRFKEDNNNEVRDARETVDKVLLENVPNSGSV
jgi:hypothetical protein